MPKSRRIRRKGKLIRKIQFQSNKVKARIKAKDTSNPVMKGRKEKVKRRRNFFVSFLATILLWLLIFCFIYFVDPENIVARVTFFVSVFFVVLFTASFVFANSRRGLITAFVITFFLILRLFGIGNILNLLLLAGLAVCIDYYKS